MQKNCGNITLCPYSGSATEDLLSSLQSAGTRYDITANDEGEIQSMSWSSLSQLELLKQYDDVFMLDGTYKVHASCAVTVNKFIVFNISQEFLLLFILQFTADFRCWKFCSFLKDP